MSLQDAQIPVTLGKDECCAKGQPYAVRALMKAAAQGYRRYFTGGIGEQCGLYALEIALNYHYRLAGFPEKQPTFAYLREIATSDRFQQYKDAYINSLAWEFQEEVRETMEQKERYCISKLCVFLQLINEDLSKACPDFPRLSLATVTKPDGFEQVNKLDVVHVQLRGYGITGFNTEEPVDPRGIVWLWHQGDHWQGMQAPDYMTYRDYVLTENARRIPERNLLNRYMQYAGLEGVQHMTIERFQEFEMLQHVTDLKDVSSENANTMALLHAPSKIWIASGGIELDNLEVDSDWLVPSDETLPKTSEPLPEQVFDAGLQVPASPKGSQNIPSKKLVASSKEAQAAIDGAILAANFRALQEKYSKNFETPSEEVFGAALQATASPDAMDFEMQKRIKTAVSPRFRRRSPWPGARAASPEGQYFVQARSQLSKRKADEDVDVSCRKLKQWKKGSQLGLPWADAHEPSEAGRLITSYMPPAATRFLIGPVPISPSGFEGGVMSLLDDPQAYYLSEFDGPIDPEFLTEIVDEKTMNSFT